MTDDESLAKFVESFPWDELRRQEEFRRELCPKVTVLAQETISPWIRLHLSGCKHCPGERERLLRGETNVRPEVALSHAEKAIFRALLDREKDEPCPPLVELQKLHLALGLDDHLAWCRHCTQERGQYLANIWVEKKSPPSLGKNKGQDDGMKQILDLENESDG